MTHPPDRPLITFALFAYNQEAYVREAIEGAFAQTYEPLEIILSDDCSTDRTFEIMQEMAAAYRGPHRVRVNLNPVNLGVGGLGEAGVRAQAAFVGNLRVIVIYRQHLRLRGTQQPPRPRPGHQLAE